MAIQELNRKSFEEDIYTKGKPGLVIFSRKTCPVCQDVVATLEELQPQYEGKFGFYYVDIEEEKALYQSFSLKGVPQVLFFKDGEFHGKLSGHLEEDQVEDKITEVLEA